MPQVRSIAERYAAYIKTDAWADTAQAAKRRAGYKCQLCGAKRKDMTLHAHHNNYSHLTKERLTDLLVLCEECYAKHHDKLPKPDDESLPLDSATNGEADAVVLPDWDDMSDDEKVNEAKRLCAAVEEKMAVRPPNINAKIADRIGIGSSTYGEYRRGVKVIRRKYRRTAYRNVRKSLAYYLNTGEFRPPTLLPHAVDQMPLENAADDTTSKEKEEEVAATEKRLVDIEKRIKANNTQFKSWKTKTANACDTTMSKLQAAIAEQQDQRLRLNVASKKRVETYSYIDDLDKKINDRCDRHREALMKIDAQLVGLAEANKLLLTKLETAATAAATAAAAAAATPWWKRWMAK